MKKLLTTLTLFAALILTSCGGATNNESSAASSGSARPSSSSTPAHVHTFDETKWESDETSHWHPATCEHTAQKGSKANHDFEEVAAEGVAPTCSVPGKKVEKCKVCGYKKVTVLTAEHDLQPVEHAQGEGEVAETIKKCSKDAYYQIDFKADDAAATLNNTSDRKSGYVKLSKQVAADGTGTASYIEWKIWSPAALKGRFWIDITGNTSNIWTREDKSNAQSLYYTYNDTTTNINTWKNKVELNGEEVDFENATYKVGEEDVKFAELTYSDFGELASNSGTPISVPMPEVNLVEGVNTLRFTRLTGYAFNMHSFSFKTSL